MTVGQKVHPYGFRLGYNKTWKSRWFAKKDYSEFLHEDFDLGERHAGTASYLYEHVYCVCQHSSAIH